MLVSQHSSQFFNSNSCLSLSLTKLNVGGGGLLAITSVFLLIIGLQFPKAFSYNILFKSLMYLPFPGFPCSKLATIKLVGLVFSFVYLGFLNNLLKTVTCTHANPHEPVTSHCKSQWATVSPD